MQHLVAVGLKSSLPNQTTCRGEGKNQEEMGKKEKKRNERKKGEKEESSEAHTKTLIDITSSSFLIKCSKSQTMIS